MNDWRKRLIGDGRPAVSRSALQQRVQQSLGFFELDTPFSAVERSAANAAQLRPRPASRARLPLDLPKTVSVECGLARFLMPAVLRHRARRRGAAHRVEHGAGLLAAAMAAGRVRTAALAACVA
jgi:hypothetical protein